ncbi:MAG: octaprenyl diphosphate synthase [Thermoplasmata archaeon]|nr:MAG: octaprenyl diphosphate synthase [Thermoplasmata archaeon]
MDIAASSQAFNTPPDRREELAGTGADFNESIRSADTQFLGEFGNYFDRIDEELERSLGSRVPLIQNIGRYSILGKGKRLRPLLFVLSSQLCGYQGEDIYRLSTVFEYIHASSLIHDDVLDHAEMRRKKPSANRVWGNLAAVLSGDFFFSKALFIAIGSHNLQFLDALTNTTVRMAEAEILELSHTNDWKMDRDAYMEVLIGKTAVLISAACACGAIISGVEDRAVDYLREFGLNAGIAFQLIDDLLDYTSCEEELGKPVGNDLKEGKITLPLIYTLSHLGKVERERLEGLFKHHRGEDDEDYFRLIELVRENGIIERIQAEAKAYVDRAARCLDMFPSSSSKEMLLKLNRYIIERKF